MSHYSSSNFDPEDDAPYTEPMCERCKCCGTSWVACDTCGGESTVGHDCGEDCCACLYPEDNVTCDTCEGTGGWWA